MTQNNITHKTRYSAALDILEDELFRLVAMALNPEVISRPTVFQSYLDFIDGFKAAFTMLANAHQGEAKEAYQAILRELGEVPSQDETPFNLTSIIERKLN